MLLEWMYINSVAVALKLIYYVCTMYYRLYVKLFIIIIGLHHYLCVETSQCSLNFGCALCASYERGVLSTALRFAQIVQVLSLKMYTSANFHRASEMCLTESSMEHVRVCFRLDCCETTKSGTYSNLWHMHGLASANTVNISCSW